MRNKEELIKTGNIRQLEDLAHQYKEINILIDNIDKELKSYQDILNSSAEKKDSYYGYADAMKEFEKEKKLFYESKSKGNVNEYNIVHQYNLHCAIEYLLNKEQKGNYKSLSYVQDDLYKSCEEIKKYLRMKMEKDGLKNRLANLFEKVKLPYSMDFLHEMGEHCFIKKDNELKCIYCDFSTKEYNLTEEELKFLSQYIEKNCRLLENATEEDLPLIENIKNKQKIDMENYVKYMNNEKDEAVREDNCINYFYVVEDLYTEMKCTINAAHNMDSKIYTNKDGDIVRDPKYLTNEKSKELMDEIDELISKVEERSDDANCKEDLIKKYKIKRYEILILSGKPIPEIFSELDNEKDKEFFVIAYGNLSDPEYREKSGYFENERIACSYECVTANPEINRRLIKIKNKDSNN